MSWSSRPLAFCDPPGLPAHGDDEPAHDRLRVLDPLAALDQPQPRGLHGVLGHRFGHALRPGRVPEHGGEQVDELVHGADVAATVGGEGGGRPGRERLHGVVGSHHASFGGKRSACACATTWRTRRGLVTACPPRRCRRRTISAAISPTIHGDGERGAAPDREARAEVVEVDPGARAGAEAVDAERRAERPGRASSARCSRLPAPGAWAVTQSPTFEKRATLRSSGLVAPTPTSPSWPGTAKAAGKNRARVASLPAQATTTTPSSAKSWRRSCRAVSSASSGVSW